MITRITILLFLLPSSLFSQNLATPFELSNGTETGTYHQVIEYYTTLADTFDDGYLLTMGETDSGYPLHVFVLSNSPVQDMENLSEDPRLVVLINNGIHPGEPDGIEASMMLARNILQDKMPEINLDNVIIGIIPIYNIGGALQRNSTTRVNQDGPVSYGFRGNARNYDLNRDFIKTDTRNASSFHEIFRLMDPDIFIDTHVSNGADYQYAITHLTTQHNKLGGPLADFLHTELRPSLEAQMEQKGEAITPYVNVFGRTPDKGFSQFKDAPRYSTGYTTLFNSLGFMIETHMLKPFDVRVKASQTFLETMLELGAANIETIKQLREENRTNFQPGLVHPVSWALDRSKSRQIRFLGYEGAMVPSEISNLPRLKYDRNKPYEKNIDYYDSFVPTREVVVPEAYLIPVGWHPVIDRLRQNGVNMRQIETDTSITVEVYTIENVKTGSNPYEGHFPHQEVVVSTRMENIKFHKGDWLIPIEPETGRYVVEVLEPEATDSFFRWNFFDTILQQKEGFSSYVFEDLALEILKENPEIQAELKSKAAADSTFANSSYAQLRFIYKQSEYAEPAYRQYPVYRLMQTIK